MTHQHILYLVPKYFRLCIKIFHIAFQNILTKLVN